MCSLSGECSQAQCLHVTVKEASRAGCGAVQVYPRVVACQGMRGSVASCGGHAAAELCASLWCAVLGLSQQTAIHSSFVPSLHPAFLSPFLSSLPSAPLQRFAGSSIPWQLAHELSHAAASKQAIPVPPVRHSPSLQDVLIEYTVSCLLFSSPTSLPTSSSSSSSVNRPKSL